ncbi:hypothetical protein SDC9_124578 [bioreactor metagenome]|uniref:Uncharacterized protein n=1 Tax=bioreactor metagenome TaxID=1076179 RepID=A0A645CLD6_9ZZZZ
MPFVQIDDDGIQIHFHSVVLAFASDRNQESVVVRNVKRQLTRVRRKQACRVHHLAPQ